MALWTVYRMPTRVDDALAALGEAPGRARIIAGGTDLLLDLQQGRQPPVHTLVDVSRVEEMRRIEAREGYVYVGAAATHREVVSNRILNEQAACLVQACSLIGGPQVRNVATIGGNVAHALPAADGTIALVALGAEAEIASSKDRQWKVVEGLFVGPGEVTFDRSREILVGFRFPAANQDETSAFHRVMRPQGVAIAIQNMAVWVRWGRQLLIEDLRLAVGAAGPRPLRARATEAVLRGRPLQEAVIEEAVGALLQEARVRTSAHRATAEYRERLLGVLLPRVLGCAGSSTMRIGWTR